MMRLICLSALLCGVITNLARADDVYFSQRVTDLKILEGSAEQVRTPNAWDWRSAQTRVVLAGDGEAYLFSKPPENRVGIGELRLVARLPQRGDVSGAIYTPAVDEAAAGAAGAIVRFQLPADRAEAMAMRDFHQARAEHYGRLAGRGIPGAAWFRHQAWVSRAALGETSIDNTPSWQRANAGADLNRTYDLFTGGRAVSENLQLDRLLNVVEGAEQTVNVDGLTGITVAEIDWKGHLAEQEPALDPLAAHIPADQHAIFFADLPAALAVLRLAEAHSIPALQAMEPRSESYDVRPRYERQLGITAEDLAELAESPLVRGVAVTGSDPYVRAGTDIAILFESPDPEALEKWLASRAEDAEAGRSFILKLPGGGVVALTNSFAQRDRIAALQAPQGGIAPRSLASLDEYRFFRQRYPRGGDESALLILSDATIRRWCGPRWRIADSRRTRAAAVLSELQARHADKIVAADGPVGPIKQDIAAMDLGEVQLTTGGMQSSLYGGTGFMTPIAELELDRVTQAEATAYNQWRDGYQRNWRWAFDPIALRLAIDESQIAGDLTVMPLIGNTDYQQMIDITRGASVLPARGDPHDALVQVVYAINIESETMRGLGVTLSQFLPGVKANPLGWLGEAVSVYLDPDPVLEELAQAEDPESFMSETLTRLPLAIHAEVENGLKLTAFLTALRAVIEQTAPGLTNWTSMEHNGQPYVRIATTEDAGIRVNNQQLSIYYVATGGGFTVTLNEAVLKRAIDRQVARRTARAGNATTRPSTQPVGEPWLGENLALHVERPAAMLLHRANAQAIQQRLQELAWNNLPALNEWRHRYPDRDPLEVHDRLWNTRLICPGGGQYIWNEQWQTMESTLYGHPGEPCEGPVDVELLNQFLDADFGVTFEEQGLRGSAIMRTQPQP